ncbi:hypothetical protein H3C61_03775 [Candidatus Gracilibacteria bacterium]|nr:hypothetical protein [Candidatus Gracilibacteria bacterium]
MILKNIKSNIIGFSISGIFIITLLSIGFNSTFGITGFSGYGSGGDYDNPSTTVDTSTIQTLTGETLTGATKVETKTPVGFSNNGVSVIVPVGTDITSGNTPTFNALIISTSTIPTLPIPIDSNKEDVGKIKFGIDGVKLNFSKPVKLQIPVTTTKTSVEIKAKHAGITGYQTSALTINPNSNCFNGIATPSSNIATVSAGIATIYTCSASEFIAIVDKTITPTVTYGGGGGGGFSLKMDNCISGDFSPSYYDGSCGNAPSVTTPNKEIEDIAKNIIDAIEESKIQTLPNNTIKDKIRFKYIVEARTQQIKYKGIDIYYIPKYDLSVSTAKLAKGIIDSKNLDTGNKRNYVNIINNFLQSKYNLDLSETKQQILKNQVSKQTILLNRVMDKISNKKM